MQNLCPAFEDSRPLNWPKFAYGAQGLAPITANSSLSVLMRSAARWQQISAEAIPNILHRNQFIVTNHISACGHRGSSPLTSACSACDLRICRRLFATFSSPPHASTAPAVDLHARRLDLGIIGTPSDTPVRRSEDLDHHNGLAQRQLKDSLSSLGTTQCYCFNSCMLAVFGRSLLLKSGAFKSEIIKSPWLYLLRFLCFN
ncbi:hypothetical protein B0H15DRAFT_804270 [Mycena belliarum]|uniref:Uncharacterized protein n=1 Tax=Mycena belliarum TaxID=1033014 RepID=A0AAD6TUG4_9AGAR|nr:hypothetical protein B0H15DRAFT_997784 [Mycena belliae]KAJ7080027.1 hypothetical protein B0H15DRAFT_804270 [Mycena belliae]